MGLFRDICLAILVASLIGGLFILDKKLDYVIAENTKIQVLEERMVSIIESLSEVFRQQEIKNTKIQVLEERMVSIIESLSEVFRQQEIKNTKIQVLEERLVSINESLSEVFRQQEIKNTDRLVSINESLSEVVRQQEIKNTKIQVLEERMVSIIESLSEVFRQQEIKNTKIQVLEERLVSINESLSEVFRQQEIKNTDRLVSINESLSEVVRQQEIKNTKIQVLEERLVSINESLSEVFRQQEIKNTDRLVSINESLSEVVRQQEIRHLKDCQDILRGGDTESGVYPIYVAGYGYTTVWCDMKTDGGGWTVFQRRRDGTIDFYRDWAGYQTGFGYLEGEFWLGNQLLHLLTSLGKYELRIDLEDFDSKKRFAVYKLFYVGGSETNYMLSVGHYRGDAGDSLTNHNGQQFSTDDNYHGSCKGAWWYKTSVNNHYDSKRAWRSGAYHASNLNGKYLKGHNEICAMGVFWASWRGLCYSLKSSQMMVRRVLS